MPAHIHDAEFGNIAITRSNRTKRVTLRVEQSGSIRITMPIVAPLFLAKRLIQSSREEIRSLLESYEPPIVFDHDQLIGKSHQLIIQLTPSASESVSINGQHIIVRAKTYDSLHSSDIQTAIREKMKLALRKEAKSYLPRRLRYLADMHGFDFQRVRFSHASTRWGSCSTSGTISLNIGLMKLRFELIDYVLLHELVHTKHMNHSKTFWECVESVVPDYKALRREIKQEHPGI